MNMQSVLKGTTCPDSYWIGVGRQELAARIATRRHQQAIPGESFLMFDPSVAATASLARDHGHSLKKLSASLMQRKGGL